MGLTVVNSYLGKNVCVLNHVRKGLTNQPRGAGNFQAEKSPLGERGGGWGSLNPRGGMWEQFLVMLRTYKGKRVGMKWSHIPKTAILLCI
jgi:hypothetical protein